MVEVAFEVKQDAIALVQNTEIEANFAECKAALAEMIAPYKSMIVTEDGIAGAKNDRARIRKIANRVDDVRKTVKKAYSEPLARFEANCKELVAICEEGSNNLDRQIKIFEDNEKQAKIAEIRAEYDAFADAEAREYCPWESIFSDKWGNKGFKIEDAKEEVLAKLNNTVVNLTSIRQMGGTDTAYLLDVYKSTHDINVVIRKQLELQAAKEREEQRRLAEEQRRQALEEEKREAERRRIAEQEKQAAPIIEETSFAEPEPADVEAEPMLAVDFRVYATREQLAGLKAYLKQNNIKFGKVG